ncbi:NAD-dependent epimerase/dehydratase family protein [Candidatus Poribacteria bacterium]|nr:NAD-dependent epimerase/dehydratase family protein [Candidatus Poribacteria bacterium]
MFKGKTLLIIGGTGSLGKTLTRRILSEEHDAPAKLIVLSRDEAKQHQMRIEYENLPASTDEVIYNNFKRLLEFRIGDVRDYHTVASVLQDVDIVFNTAALKQVPTCEYFPYEAVRTNVTGPENIIRAVQELSLNVQTVIGISTDKACKPVNVMGMTKAIQERVIIQGNMLTPRTRFACVRYGNVLASRGSVIPLFHEQIKSGGPITVTTEEMTRFFLGLDQAVDVIFAALREAKPGEIYIPKVPSARIMDLAEVLIGSRNIDIKITGIRPGEKIHEILVSEEESFLTQDRGEYYAIAPILPELRDNIPIERVLNKEYSSRQATMSQDELKQLLQSYGLLVGQQSETNRQELLR